MAEANVALDLQPDSGTPDMTQEYVGPISLESGYGTISGSFNAQVFRPEFIKSTPESYNCNHCKKIALNPTKAECGHLFCCSCIQQHFHSNPDTTVCPNPEYNDCQHITKNGLFSDKRIQRELQKLSVYCPNKNIGCSKSMPWQDLEEHIRICQLLLHDQDTYTREETNENKQTDQLYEPLSLSDGLELIEKKLTTEEGGMKSLTCSLAENMRQLKILEETMYDGTQILKVENYAERKQDAIFNRALYIESSPFFTGKPGYKMCIRVYLNGEGATRSTHISVYFVLMKGELDDLLQWPFQQTVTLMLLDLISGQHLIETFEPDKNSSCFKQPVVETNESFGPWVVGMAMAERLIHDDTLFVKGVVDKYTA